MASDYIPTQDAEALAFMQNFSALITAAPATYGLVAADATAIDAAVDAFAAAYAVAFSPATRTPVSINTKDEAREDAEAIVRQYASQIKVDAGVTDSNKIAIGVRPVNNSRTPVPPPATFPMLNIAGNTPGVQTLRYSDSATPDSAAKPAGALNLQLFRAIGTAPASDPEAAMFQGAHTKNPIAVDFDTADDGKVATYFARWSTRTGEVGPWSLPVSMRIAA
jgi:hypothetical protein